MHADLRGLLRVRSDLFSTGTNSMFFFLRGESSERQAIRQIRRIRANPRSPLNVEALMQTLNFVF